MTRHLILAAGLVLVPTTGLGPLIDVNGLSASPDAALHADPASGVVSDTRLDLGR